VTYRWLYDLADVLAGAGLPVARVDGWDGRGRPESTGQFDPTGVCCHHTASPAGTPDSSELNVILAGNSEAPGPISQLLIGREYQGVYVVAAGRANHAGSGLVPWLGDQKSDGNAATIGIEVANDGSGEAWPDWQTDVYARTCAALCAAYGWPLDHVLIHHDLAQPYYPGSKCDPAGPWLREPDLAGGFAGTWDVNVWRTYIAEFWNGAPGPGGDDDMTDEEHDWLANVNHVASLEGEWQRTIETSLGRIEASLARLEQGD
jgi:hypothetical protein